MAADGLVLNYFVYHRRRSVRSRDGLIRITCTYGKNKWLNSPLTRVKIKLVTDQQQQESVADAPAAETLGVFFF